MYLHFWQKGQMEIVMRPKRSVTGFQTLDKDYGFSLYYPELPL